MVNVCFAGLTGWTAQPIVRAINEANDLVLTAGVSRSAAGRSLGEFGGSSAGSVYATVVEALQAAEVDVLVDYTSATAVRQHVEAAVDVGVHVVVGSSGLSAEDYATSSSSGRSSAGCVSHRSSKPDTQSRCEDPVRAYVGKDARGCVPIGRAGREADRAGATVTRPHVGYERMPAGAGEAGALRPPRGCAGAGSRRSYCFEAGRSSGLRACVGPTRRIYRPAVDAPRARAGSRTAGSCCATCDTRRRHSCSRPSLALEVAQRLGHSRPSTTMDIYARFIPSDNSASTDALDRFIADSVSTPCQHQVGSSP